MSNVPDAVCLNVSPALKWFDRPFLRELSKRASIAQWEYTQSPDEPCSLDKALILLHDYLKHFDRPVHLIGHGLSGTLGLLYSRQHPKHVRSLSLLSVGVFPSIDWQAHYYVQRQLFRCSRTFVLAQVAKSLFGRQCELATRRMIEVLEKDLDTSPSAHSICYQHYMKPGCAPVPLMVGRGELDVVIDPNALEQWQPWFKECDFQWECPDGLHFFQYSHPHRVALKIWEFWNSIPSQSLPHLMSGVATN
ncbi:MAG: alpha/beta hydrolase [Cyanobacteria bacterium J06627_8]